MGSKRSGEQMREGGQGKGLHNTQCISSLRILMPPAAAAAALRCCCQFNRYLLRNQANVC
jgi:hypothetical protein